MKMCKTDKFEPVEVIKSFLGIKKGTVLKFDGASSKYISRVEEEEIGDNDYYYSGHAIAIDPLIVENNLGKHFKLLELKAAPVQPAIEEKEQEVPPVKFVSCEKTENTDAPDQEPVRMEKKRELPPEKADLVFECGLCHFVNKIASVRHGVFFPVGKDTFLKIKCENCGITTNIYYDIADDTTEESKQG